MRPLVIFFLIVWCYLTSAQQANVRFLVGSCAFIADTTLQEKNPGYPEKIFLTMSQHPTDFMLWLGDNVYFRREDYQSAKCMRSRYQKNFSNATVRTFLESRKQYAIWDDHDFGPNDGDGSFELKDSSRKIFSEVWRDNPSVGEQGLGIYTKVQFEDIDLFLLDDRYFKTKQQGKRGILWGKQQLKWLERELKESNATFKIIANGTQILNEICPYESAMDYPAERMRLLEIIKKNKIEGALFLTGDRHTTELLKKIDYLEYPLYDFTCSPLSSKAYGRAGTKEENNPLRVKETVVGVQNFGKITVFGEKRDRKLLIEVLDSFGEKKWDYQITAKELSYL